MTAVASADIYKLAGALRASAQQSAPTTQDVLYNVATYLKTDMESRVPVRTGRLRQSIEIRVNSHGVTVGPDTPYAAYVEFGTAPHVIQAKPGKTLAFRVGGQMIFRKKVNHPGTKAQPYVRPAFEDWVDTLGQMAAEANIKVIESEYQ